MGSRRILFDITIQTLVYGGNGLGRLPDGKAVFVPFVLPGEVVRVQIREEKKRHAFGELVEVLAPSPQRIIPKCKHYRQCGGCHLQHTSYAQQATLKQAMFKEQLQRIGHVDPLPKIDFVPAEKHWHYRNTIQFHTTQEGALAFMDAADARPFAVEECWLPMGDISALWPQVSLEAGMDIARLELRQNAMGEMMMVLESRGETIPAMEMTLPISAVHTRDDEAIVLAGDEHLTQTVLGQAFQVSAGSFFQTNFEGAAALVETVQRMTAGLGGTLLDLYCGVGLFSRFLAAQFEQVIGIELSASACADYAHNMRDVEAVFLYQGAVEEALREAVIEADCAVVDPPRRGMDRFALDALAETRVPVIVYVSCDPSTLARDIQRLGKSGYVVEEAVVVDMFPQTYHIESVNLLRLA